MFHIYRIIRPHFCLRQVVHWSVEIQTKVYDPLNSYFAFYKIVVKILYSYCGETRVESFCNELNNSDANFLAYPCLSYLIKIWLSVDIYKLSASIQRLNILYLQQQLHFNKKKFKNLAICYQGKGYLRKEQRSQTNNSTYINDISFQIKARR